MNSENTLKHTNEFAAHYDEYIANTHWYGPEMLFGMMYSSIKSGENLLDLGIGTGLSSKLFQSAGLRIYGVDGSDEMIKICLNKGFTEDVRFADLSSFKSPYGVAVFEHAVSIGVFHLVGNLQSIFSEVSRSLKTNGLFGFTTIEYLKDNPEDYKNTHIAGIYSKLNIESDILIFKHSDEYINTLLKEYNFRLFKRTVFLGYFDEKSNRKYYFTAYILQKKA
jgi:predicted TPR repeat methyltransferase